MYNVGEFIQVFKGLMKYGKKFYGRYTPLTPAVVKINKFYKKILLKAMKICKTRARATLTHIPNNSSFLIVSFIFLCSGI